VARPWFAARPVDESFFDSAPIKLADTFAIDRPASEVWAQLTAEKPLRWCRVIDDVTWTSERPYGVGTTRSVRSLRGGNLLRERFFRWEEGRRKSFYVVEASGPPVRAFAEDYLVEPVTDGSCRFTWTIAYEPHPLTRPTAALTNRLLRTLFTDTRKHFAH
jgi:hypothetical protein